MSVQVTSFMPSGNATVTRPRERCMLPFLAVPQAMSLYTRFVHHTNDNTATRRVWQIGAGANTGPRLSLLFGASNRFNALYQNTPTAATQFTAAAVSPNLGDTVECRVCLSAAGLVTIGVSINGGGEVTAVGAQALVLPAAWSAQQIWFNSNDVGTANVGANDFLNVLALAGVQSMITLQRRAGTLVR